MAPMRMAVIGLCLVLVGCASLSPYQERPQVNITSFTTSPQTGTVAPRFLIGVQVINPNRSRLPLRGMSYSVEIEGTRILSGVANDLPEVPAYGSADFIIEATPDLFGSARVLADIFGGRRERIDYNFRARLDVGRWMPDLVVEERGSVRLSN